jgi:hypothetical protein
MTRRLILLAIPLLLAIASGVAVAQFGGGGRRGGMPQMSQDSRKGIPSWSNDARFKHDIFTFVRVEYSSGGGGRGFSGPFGGMGQMGFQRRGGGGGRRGGGGYGGWGGWRTDWPDSDLNFSLRLSQLTSIKVNPDPISLQLTEPELFDYPFLYMIEPGALMFHDDEIVALKKYLLNGGFMMVDDFWGDDEYENFHREIKRVFPEQAQEPMELPADHEIFHNVYRLKEKPQVPSMHAYLSSGLTYERPYDGDTKDVHYKGIFDDKGRMMVLICHNTDLGDGWEREGQSHEYFKEFSEKKSYPMGINIVTYAMTH